MRPSTRIPLRRKTLIILCTFALIAMPGGRGTGQATSTPTASQPVDSRSILQHLNEILSWYNQTRTKVDFSGLPSDAVYQSELENFAAKTVQLAFQSAKAEAALAPSSQQPQNNQSNGGAARENLTKTLDNVTARIAAIQSQLNDLNARITKVSRIQAESLKAQRDQLQGELDLRNAMRSNLELVIKSSNENGAGQGSLAASVAQLEQSVPELSSNNQQAAKTAPATGNTAPPSKGLIGEAVSTYDQFNTIHQLSQLIEETDRVRKTAAAVRTPLQQALRATISQGQQLADTTGDQPATGQPSMRQQFDAVTQRFKQLSDAMLPLTQELALLDQSRSTLVEWRTSILRESRRSLRSVLLRVAGIAIAIGIVLLLSEIWRRVTFRYVKDLRRRRQFLLVRRIVIGMAMGVVLILGFVSEFSSLATFAGFITAGLAVGLQTILLSVAAYFFLVGRWGIRVGDRISISGVTGEVVDVGLVRLYLMELSGAGVDIYPTGRIVVFANSVLFQATTPLFKQIPGTEYTWHEMVVGLNPSGGLKAAEEKLLGLVLSIYKDYQEDFARQHGDLERRIDLTLKVPEPQSQIQFADTGLELVVRYPVALDRAAEVDAKVTRALLEAIGQDPDLKPMVVGHPAIRAAVKG